MSSEIRDTVLSLGPIFLPLILFFLFKSQFFNLLKRLTRSKAPTVDDQKPEKENTAHRKPIHLPWYARLYAHELANNASQLLKPKIHEISAYLIAFSCCWLLYFHAQLRQDLLIIFSGFETMSPFFLVLGLLLLWGLFLSLVHAFIKRKKSASEKYFMGWFIMGMSGFASFGVGVEMLPSRSSTLLLLPVWNILIGLFMLFQMGAQEYDVIDEDASPGEVFITTLILLVILVLTDLVFHLSWALILSISVFYATSIVLIASVLVNYFGVQTPEILK